MDYRELEKAVFDHLYTKHQTNSTFTFSVRKLPSKGATLDYFIGTEKSNYLGFTLWDIPVGFPGSSGDLVDFICAFKKGEWQVYFQYHHTRKPEGEQNIISLQLGKILREIFQKLSNEEFYCDANPLTNKMEYFEVHTYAKHKSFEDILNSIDKLMFFVSPIVDREISQLKERNPNWVAGRIESEKFDNMIKWMTDRQLRSKDAMTEQKGGIMYEEDQFPKNNNHHPLNLILYGPPGTGKTYITKNLAVQIAENKSEKELNEIYPTRESLNEAFKKLQERGQIGFVTFHQSFGYEDFIEGIKPIMVDGKDGSPSSELGEQKVLNYEIKDGIFKMMSVRAESYQSFSSESKQMMFDKQIIDNLDKKQFFKMSLGNTANEDDQIIYEYCLENNCIALGWGQEIDYNRAKDEGEIGKLLEEHGGSQSSYEISAVKCFIFGMKVGDIVFISDGNLKARAIGMIEGNYFYDYHSTIYYKHFRKVRWLAKNISIPVDQIYGRQFSQQTIYGMYSHLVKKDFFINANPISFTSTNHVLIIDEINRGNIASIFGELITLIEDDKRKGGREFLSITLPYSKKPFSVPSNLYLIGTMNTADRSVEALDTALRRRFAFRHMQPEPDKLGMTVEGIDLNRMLTTINQRLEVLLDADHTIGHAWLWDVKDFKGLKAAFKDKILPLLQEFFYNDYEKIGLVLGAGFVSVQNAKEYMGSSGFADFNKNSDLASTYTDQQVFKLKEAEEDKEKGISGWQAKDFISIYSPRSKANETDTTV